MLYCFSLHFILLYEKINPKELAKNLVASRGRIDGDLILLNTKYSARVDKIWVKDGDKITRGQTIAHLKSDEFINHEKSIKESILSLEKEKLSFAQITNAQEFGTISLISTSYMQEASKMDKILLFDDGEIIAKGTASELLKEIEPFVYENAKKENANTRNNARKST